MKKAATYPFFRDWAFKGLAQFRLPFTNPFFRDRVLRGLVLFKFTLVLAVLTFDVNAKNLYAQNTVSLSEKNAALPNVLKKIQKQTGFNYFGPAALLQNAQKVTVEIKNAELKDALDIIFQAQPFTYSIIGNTIVIKEREEAKKNLPAQSSFQNIDVQGRVVNEKGDPVEAVSVTVKGSAKATSTNASGEFLLSGVDQNAILVFTSVNMETFELSLKGRTNISISLRTKISALGDVTVTPPSTGYQVLRPNEVTGAVVVVSKEQLDQRVAPDIITKLEGMVPGLVFNKDAENGNNKLRIRGESTIFGYTEPLIVVDGFPYDGDISNLNPNDVENITVLKDAAAASIWGVQAGNGVIVITTKKGKFNQRLRVGLNSNMTVTRKPDLFHAPFVGPSEYINIEQLLFDRGYFDGRLSDPTYPVVSPVVEILARQRAGQITQAEATAQINALRQVDYRDEALKHVYKSQIQQQHSINFSGGNNKSAYFFSIGYDKNHGGVIGVSNDRLTLRGNNTFIPIKNLEFNIGLVYTEGAVNSNEPTLSNAFPYTRLRDENGNELAIPQRRATFEDTIANRGFINWKLYPFRDQQFMESKTKSYDTRVITGLRYKIFKGLSFEGSYSYGRSLVRERTLEERGSYKIRNLLNAFATLSNGNYTGSNFPDGGVLTMSTGDLVSHNGRVNLSYNGSWADHSVTAIVGFDAREIRTEGSGSKLYGYNDENGSFVLPNYTALYPTFPAGPSLNIGTTGLSYSSTTNRFRSYFGNAVYVYKNRYSISGSARLDGSNYFGVDANRKSIPLWSTGLKWNISQEKFFRFQRSLDLSLRASYGYSGNMAQNVSALPVIRYSGNSIVQLPYALFNNIPNEDLGWEKIGQLNIGLDFSTINQRIRGSIDYFIRRGKDLIGDAPIDPTTGVSTMRGNFSALETKGIDLSLSTRNTNGQFKWLSTLLFNYSADKITRYDIPNSPVDYLKGYNKVYPLVGRPLYSFYSYRWGGLDPANGNPRIFLGDTLNQNYAASNIFSKVTLNDLVYNGRYNPPITGTFRNDFSWRGFTLTVSMLYKFGHYFRRTSADYSQVLQNNGTLGFLHKDLLLRWQKPGDERTTDVPSLLYPDNSGGRRDIFYVSSDVLVEKGDHIRLQYVNLSYDINKNQFPRLPLQSLQIYVYAHNLGIIWRANSHNIDPDFPYTSNPPAPSWSFGIRGNF